ncbi:unnamed protein product [Kuraishia capsulata CBS 1993]|uniref:Phosphotyrosine protein phosphatase I domain-containing protein n=1 Tax=Kuraishia capsulata CBS 1993 TaxID=1382522 RepID=W6MFE0_9ASCO|nr:uncharacterized protein KUCA_T00000231001 [Kuraishia capsulata CBS 1993]CDK24271.1 unnamed protein product [Kuraishia capsulata CBS 1993]
MTNQKFSVAFVCMGNICRSPMAEAVFNKTVSDLGYSDSIDKVDSFGTHAYHSGEDPDYRTLETCRRHSVPVKHHAQSISANDFKEFDYIIGMDRSNMAALEKKRPQGSKAIVKMFGEWRTDPSYGKIIEDPYYGGSSGFERCYNQVRHFSEEFLKQEIGEK